MAPLKLNNWKIRGLRKVYREVFIRFGRDPAEIERASDEEMQGIVLKFLAESLGYDKKNDNGAA